MIVECPNCETRFRLDAERLRPEGSKVRCSRCSHVFRAFPPKPVPEPVGGFAAGLEDALDDELETSSLEEDLVSEVASTETRRVDAAALVAFALDSADRREQGPDDERALFDGLLEAAASPSELFEELESASEPDEVLARDLTVEDASASTFGIEAALRDPSVDLPEDEPPNSFLDIGDDSVDIGSADLERDFLPNASPLAPSPRAESFGDGPMLDDEYELMTKPARRRPPTPPPWHQGYEGFSAEEPGTPTEAGFPMSKSISSSGSAVARIGLRNAHFEHEHTSSLPAKPVGARVLQAAPKPSPRAMGAFLGLAAVLGVYFMDPQFAPVVQLKDTLLPRSGPVLKASIPTVRTVEAAAFAHEGRNGPTIVVRGEARNEGDSVVQVLATVLMLDEEREVSRASAPVSSGQLEPGQSGPFTVVFDPAPPGAARYRFRIEFESS